MNIQRRAYGILFCILLCIVAVLWMFRVQIPSQKSASQQHIRLISPDGVVKSMSVEIADDKKEQNKGLMSRTNLAEGSGMLFVFEQPQELTFWMKNTLIPLDIFFFDTNGLFVSRTTMFPCRLDPCEVHSSRGAALYALEVNHNEVMTANIGIGWRLVF